MSLPALPPQPACPAVPCPQVAAYHGHVEAVETLLRLGADPDTRGPRSWTPLMWAAHRGNQQVAEALLRGGADPLLRTPDSRTALLVAQQAGRTAVAERLRAAEVGGGGLGRVHRAPCCL